MCVCVLCSLAGMIVDIPLSMEDIKSLIQTFLNRRNPSFDTGTLQESNSQAKSPGVSRYPSLRNESDDGHSLPSSDTGVSEERPCCRSIAESETTCVESNRSAILSCHALPAGASNSELSVDGNNGRSSQTAPGSNHREKQTTISEETMCRIDALVDAARHALNDMNGQGRLSTLKEDILRPCKPSCAVETLQQIADMYIKVEAEESSGENYQGESPLLVPLGGLPVSDNAQLVDVEVADILKEIVMALTNINQDVPLLKECPTGTSSVYEGECTSSSTCTPSKDVAHYVECSSRCVQNELADEVFLNGIEKVDHAVKVNECLTGLSKLNMAGLHGMERSEAFTESKSPVLSDISVQRDTQTEPEEMQENRPSSKNPQTDSPENSKLSLNEVESMV